MNLSISFLLLIIVFMLLAEHGPQSRALMAAIFAAWIGFVALDYYESHQAAPAAVATTTSTAPAPATTGTTTPTEPNISGPQKLPELDTRDYLACRMQPAYQTIETFKRHWNREPSINEIAKMTAQIRYIEADAMIAARKLSAVELTGSDPDNVNQPAPVPQVVPQTAPGPPDMKPPPP